MSGLKIPEMSRKIQLLMDAGLYPNRTAFAAALGKRPATIRGWINGSSGPEPETVPQQNVQAFVTLVTKALPGLPESQIQDVLKGPASDLEQHLFPQGRGSFLAFVRKEAVPGHGVLFVEESGLGLIRRIRKYEPDPEHNIALGQGFRIEFSFEVKARHALGLQAAPGGWGVVPATLISKGKIIHLPGQGDGGDPGFMAEDNEIGRHKFIAMATHEPIPPDIHKAGLDGLPLDRNLLEHLRRFYLQQDASQRALLIMDVEVTPSSHPNPGQN